MSTLDRKLRKPFPSKVKGKKFSVYVLKDGKRKLIHFGQAGAIDWRSGKATKEQRASYRARASGILKKDGSRAIDDRNSPAYFSYSYLW